jgi:hypothetical protein
MPTIGMASGETAELVDAVAVFTHEAPAIPRTASAGLKTPIHLETLPCMVTLLALTRKRWRPRQSRSSTLHAENRMERSSSKLRRRAELVRPAGPRKRLARG